MASQSMAHAVHDTKRNKIIAVSIAVLVALVGTFLLATHASGPFASVNATNATVTSPATLVTDAAASAGKAIQFNAAAQPPPPPTSTKPDATNTGVPADQQAKLTTVKGNQVFDSSYNGQTISNKDFQGYVKVTGSNITFKNCKFEGGTPNGNNALLDLQNDNQPGTGNIVEDSEFVPLHPNATIDGIWAQNVTILRVNIHGSTDGIKASSNTTIQDSYIHDMKWYDFDPNTTDGTHNDCVQILDGTNVRVVHNNMNPNDSRANSSVQITQDFGTTGAVLLDSNWADWGGFSFNISQKRNSDLSDTLKGVSVTNNRFGRHGEYGAIKIGTGVTLAAFSGNVWDDTGLAIPPPPVNNN